MCVLTGMECARLGSLCHYEADNAEAAKSGARLRIQIPMTYHSHTTATSGFDQSIQGSLAVLGVIMRPNQTRPPNRRVDCRPSAG